MPANRGLGSPNWNPQPDFLPHAGLNATVDERVFEIDDELQVRDCLLETDPTYAAYEWDMSESELHALALESARCIVYARRELLATRRLEQEFEQAKARRDARFMSEHRSSDQTRKAVVAGFMQNLVTGEITNYASEVPMGRVFG